MPQESQHTEDMVIRLLEDRGLTCPVLMVSCIPEFDLLIQLFKLRGIAHINSAVVPEGSSPSFVQDLLSADSSIPRVYLTLPLNATVCTRLMVIYDLIILIGFPGGTYDD